VVSQVVAEVVEDSARLLEVVLRGMEVLATAARAAAAAAAV
jgi:hypothetical protein